MRPIHTLIVVPSLPPAIEALRRIAFNLRWCWNHESVELFRRLDRDLWETTGHNPVRLLGAIEQSKLEAAAGDEAFLAHLERVESQLESYLQSDTTWFHRTYGGQTERPLIAYFSAEFGLTECLSIFAGGLGILAGDHLKSASDLGVPLIGVGLLYQQGYFRQYMSQSGWQQEAYEENDFHNLPISNVFHAGRNAALRLQSISPVERSLLKFGGSRSAASLCTCWIPTYPGTRGWKTAS